MLLNLRIRDFAIIDAVELELPPGFTVVTGETGAGKSIVVDALTVAMGGRASADLVRTGAETAEVEALFDISAHPVVQARLEQRDLVGDDPNVLVIRRVVGAKGKAKVVINGRLATVATLAELVRGLVDISGQHDQQSLLVVENHLEILDAYACVDPLKSSFKEVYERLRQLRRERDRLQKSEDESLRRADFLRFQVEEITRVNARPGEDQSLEAERLRLAHAEKLRHGVDVAEALLYGEDGSAFDKVGKAAAETTALARIDPELAAAAAQLGAARREIEEAARVLQRYAGRIDVDPARLADVDERLNELARLCRKHGGRIDDVLSRQAELMAELDALEHADERLASLDSEVQRCEVDVLRLAQELSEQRQAAAARFHEAIEAEVADMDLNGAVFRTLFTARTSPGDEVALAGRGINHNGLDDVEFVWSANRGEPPRSLARIASGGELSRLMLAVKRVLCNRDLVSVYVFDEVDSGLGGKAADSIGRKIQAVAAGHQALTITHLAPIAARADYHLRVRKEERGERTVSVLEPVEGALRAEEIARMIDGANITKATRQAAKAMLARSRDAGDTGTPRASPRS